MLPKRKVVSIIAEKVRPDGKPIYVLAFVTSRPEQRQAKGRKMSPYWQKEYYKMFSKW